MFNATEFTQENGTEIIADSEYWVSKISKNKSISTDRGEYICMAAYPNNSGDYIMSTQNSTLLVRIKGNPHYMLYFRNFNLNFAKS